MSIRKWLTGAILAAGLSLFVLIPARAVGPTFHPDATFKGNALTGWHPLGEADWKASNGEITATPKQPGGGWLMSDKPLQDVAIFTNFKATGGAKFGVLFRAEKTADGMKGIFVSLNQGDVASYAITLDASGKETSRTKLRTAGAQVRIAPTPEAMDAAAAGRGGRGGPGRSLADQFAAPPGVTLPISRPKGGIHDNDWNQVELLLDSTIVRGFLNDGAEVAGGAAYYEYGKFGPMALYVGGTGQIQFKDLSWSDLNVKVMPKEQVSKNFTMQRLNEFFYSFSAAAADVDRDGNLDVIAGPYVYYGPDYTKSREIYTAETYSPSRSYSSLSMVNMAGDFSGNGWPDVITTGGAGATLYVNPRNEARFWDKRIVAPACGLEISLAKDIDSDGRPELICGGQGILKWAKPDPANPNGPWVVHNVTLPGPWGYLHSLGVGDINGDGRQDVISTWGWWEHPASETGEPWTYHPEAFGRWTRSYPGGGEITVYDVNGDGLNDVVTPLQAHGMGIAWYEQRRDQATNKISFVQHMIMDDYLTKNAGGVTFTQPHASVAADIDGDGVPDFIVGKRYWSHQDDFYDPDPYGAPVLYWYRTVRNAKAPGGAEFVPELIHNRSGGGSTLLAVDLNKDGAIDVVTSTDRGTFIFWGRQKAKK